MIGFCVRTGDRGITNNDVTCKTSIIGCAYPKAKTCNAGRLPDMKQQRICSRERERSGPEQDLVHRTVSYPVPLVQPAIPIYAENEVAAATSSLDPAMAVPFNEFELCYSQATEFSLSAYYDAMTYWK